MRTDFETAGELICGESRHGALNDFRLSAASRRAPMGGPAKRIFDLVLTMPALVAVLPVLVLIAVAIKFSDGGPALFSHRRIGYRRQPFHCYKFRTMVMNGDEVLAKHFAENSEAAQEWRERRKLSKDPRVTALGRFLRMTSLDELPQIFNIVLGEMSVVGPRPVTEQELPFYDSYEDIYVLARPGLTGAWQVSGRSALTFAARVRLDVEYVSSWSLYGDLVIVLRTIPVVLLRRGSC